MPTNLAFSLHLFVQLGVVLLACWAVGQILRRMGQPQVVADMVAGFLLGPTLFGLAVPTRQHWLFPGKLVLNTNTVITHPSMIVLYVLGQLGLVLYMFIVGLTFRPDILGQHLKSSIGSAAAGIIIPIIAGGAFGWMLGNDGTFFGAKVEPWQAALFVGAAMAITAFPMLARIIYENKLSGTPTGTVALACAAVDDTFAWILLAVVVSAAQNDAAIAVMAVVGATVYVTAAVTVGRRLTRWLARGGMDSTGGLRQSGLTLTLVMLLICAAFTEAVGIYAVVGAFLFGAIIPKGSFNSALQASLELVTVRVLLPLFFAYSGLITRFDLLLQPKILRALLVAVAVAFSSKGLACAFGARLAGLPWKSSASVGALMNARGLMELILLNIGLERIVTPALYTVLALMTVVTTLAATPLYLLIQRRLPGVDAMSSITPEIVPVDDIESRHGHAGRGEAIKEAG